MKEASSLDDRADRELDRLITKRHDPRDGGALLEPSYAESVRRYNARRREELDLERYEYHRGQAVRLRAVLESLIREHERNAEKYLAKGA